MHRWYLALKNNAVLSERREEILRPARQGICGRGFLLRLRLGHPENRAGRDLDLAQRRQRDLQRVHGFRAGDRPGDHRLEQHLRQDIGRLRREDRENRRPATIKNWMNGLLRRVRRNISHRDSGAEIEVRFDENDNLLATYQAKELVVPLRRLGQGSQGRRESAPDEDR